MKTLYSILIDNYKPGAELYMFGFSRGSYILRSLSSIIRVFGIMKKTAFSGRAVNKLFEKYKRYNQSEQKEKPVLNPDHFHKVESIKFLGLFDTVSGLSEEEEKEHDVWLDEKFVNSYCHLMATNLTSPYFNISFVRRGKVENPLKHCEQIVPDEKTNRIEIQCPGDHSGVGGGWEQQPMKNKCLSNSTLKLMADSARRSGLSFENILFTAYPTYDTSTWKEGIRSVLDPVHMYQFSLAEWSLHQVVNIFKRRACRMNAPIKVRLYCKEESGYHMRIVETGERDSEPGILEPMLIYSPRDHMKKTDKHRRSRSRGARRRRLDFTAYEKKRFNKDERKFFQNLYDRFEKMQKSPLKPGSMRSLRKEIDKELSKNAKLFSQFRQSASTLPY